VPLDRSRLMLTSFDSLLRVDHAKHRETNNRDGTASSPHDHWKTTTFSAALRHDGLTAPLVIDGAINGELFLAYVKQIGIAKLV